MRGTWGGASQHRELGEAEGEVGEQVDTAGPGEGLVNMWGPREGDLARGWSTHGVLGRGTWVGADHQRWT